MTTTFKERIREFKRTTFYYDMCTAWLVLFSGYKISRKLNSILRYYYEPMEWNGDEEDFEPTNKPSPVLAGFRDVRIRYQSEYISVRISTTRPGMLIGMGGKSIDELQSSLIAAFNKQVIIRIHEAKYW